MLSPPPRVLATRLPSPPPASKSMTLYGVKVVQQAEVMVKVLLLA
jgi:hypothetical protein